MGIILIISINYRDVICGVLTLRTAEGQLKALTVSHEALLKLALSIIILVLIGSVIKPEHHGGFFSIKPRMLPIKGPATIISVITAKLIRNLDSIASTAEITITKANHTNETISARVSGTKTNGTCIALLNINFQDYCTWLNTRHARLYIYSLKETKIIDTLIASYNLFLIQRLANLASHLTADNLILGLFVALYDNFFNYTLSNTDSQNSIISYIQIIYLSHYIAILHILLLDCSYVFLQGTTVQALTWNHSNQLHKSISRLYLGVANQIDLSQNRSLLHIIGYSYTLWHLFKARIQIVEETGIIYSV